MIDGMGQSDSLKMANFACAVTNNSQQPSELLLHEIMLISINNFRFVPLSLIKHGNQRERSSWFDTDFMCRRFLGGAD